MRMPTDGLVIAVSYLLSTQTGHGTKMLKSLSREFAGSYGLNVLSETVPVMIQMHDEGRSLQG